LEGGREDTALGEAQKDKCRMSHFHVEAQTAGSTGESRIMVARGWKGTGEGDTEKLDNRHQITAQ
jgi:hypothetical protein